MQIILRLQGLKMHFLFVFLVILGGLTPGELKTNEQLEQELNMMKIKFENKMKNIETEMVDIRAKTKKAVHWSGMQTKIWGDDQCKNLGNFGNLNFGLEDCKKKCLKTATCTAINYNKGINSQGVSKDCVLRGCTQPVQPPQYQYDDYRGYYIMDQEEHSMFCAYQNLWSPEESTITYTKLLLAENNIFEASFDIGSGKFTAGVKGVYRVDLSIGSIGSSIHLPNTVYFQLNGVNIEESKIDSGITTQHISKESGARSMLVRMKRGDRLSVYVDSSSGTLSDITFCISYGNLVE